MGLSTKPSILSGPSSIVSGRLITAPNHPLLFLLITVKITISYIKFCYTAMKYSLVLAALAGSVSSTILWDGRFNDMTSSLDLNNWSWSDEVGPYQYYIVC